MRFRQMEMSRQMDNSHCHQNWFQTHRPSRITLAALSSLSKCYFQSHWLQFWGRQIAYTHYRKRSYHVATLEHNKNLISNDYLNNDAHWIGRYCRSALMAEFLHFASAIQFCTYNFKYFSILFFQTISSQNLYPHIFDIIAVLSEWFYSLAFCSCNQNACWNARRRCCTFSQALHICVTLQWANLQVLLRPSETNRNSYWLHSDRTGFASY